MAQETLKITITADNQQAVQNIQETVTATQKLGTAFKTLPSTSNQATTALSNLSRVAQDAPYGFIGIANNLNPLLESFQRLSKDAGGAGAALKAMAGGLMGPAGIGLALGAVSSLIVAFGPKLADFISGTTEASKAEDKFAQSLRDARAEASETGIRLQAYLTISQNANVSEERRAEAFKAVVTELSKVNKAYASTITTVDQARGAVELYTQALVAQAITTRYIDEIANKTIALAEANKKIIQTGREYYATLESTKLAINGYADASVYQASAIAKAKDANIDARNEALALRSGIIGLRTEVNNLYVSASGNPFFNFIKGADDTTKATDKATKSVEKLGKQARVLKVSTTQIIETENTVTTPTTPNKLSKDLPMFAQQYTAEQIFKNEAALKAYNQQLQLANGITDTVTPAFEAMFQAMANGENIGRALEESFKQIIIQLTTMIVKALIFKAVMSALGIPTAGGGGGLTNLASDFGSTQGGGQFVLRGQDLLLATNRAQKASNLKGQNISLA
jgi:uncharacterized protein YoxC